MKLGTFVKIKDDGEARAWWCQDMKRCLGKVGIIVKHCRGGYYEVSGMYGKNNKPYFFFEEDLEVVKNGN